MDKLLKTLKEIKDIMNFRGTINELSSLEDFTNRCKKLNLIPSNIRLTHIPREMRDDFINYLVEMTHQFVLKNKIDSWKEFERHPGCIRISSLLFQFGVRGVIFPLEFENDIVVNHIEENKKITLREFYQLYQIQFNYDGSFGSFKKFVEKKYGSFAEYCLLKGYDINNTKWESEETAIRVAQKIGTPNQVKLKSTSLYKYLEERNLLTELRKIS